jgi:hypothetical protein
VAVCSRAVIGRRAGARPTTSSTGCTAAPPTWTTWPYSAGPIIGRSMKAAGGSTAAPMGSSPPAHRIEDTAPWPEQPEAQSRPTPNLWGVPARRGLRGDPDAPITHVCLFGGDRGWLPGRCCRRPGCAHASDGGAGPAGQPGGVGVRAQVGRVPGAGARRRGRAAAAQSQRGRHGGLVPGAGRAGRGVRGARRGARRGGRGPRQTGRPQLRGPPGPDGRPGWRATAGGGGELPGVRPAVAGRAAADRAAVRRAPGAAGGAGAGRAGCGSPAGSTTAWCRQPGGGSGSCWARW